MSKKYMVSSSNSANAIPLGATNGTDMKGYVIFSEAIGGLEGKILTFVDASISDQIQRKAMKDLLRPMIWQWAIEADRSEHFDIVHKKESIK